ncbi:MAG TPA: Ig domain-containing protein, partial [Verrucomicrobiae bacterium]
LVIQIQPSTLADGQVNVAYSAQLAVLGGTPPYLWTLSPTSAGLPYNLSLSPDGLLSGRPMEAGVYDFSIRVTDAGGRYVEQVYSLKINP